MTVNDGRAVAVIATAGSMSDLSLAIREIGRARLAELGFSLKIGAHADKRYLHTAGTVEERLSDLHGFLDDPEVVAILPVFGGYNTNQLLPRLDYDKIEAAGKSFTGYSDTTALLAAVGRHTRAPIFHGPSFSVLCDPNLFDYTFEGLKHAWAGETVAFTAPAETADDLWFLKEGFGPRECHPSSGWTAFREGTSSGLLMGGNLETLCALAGTPYFPKVEECILFLEDTGGSNPAVFHRYMTQLAQMNVFSVIDGLLIGAMPHGSKLSDHTLLGAILDDVLDDARSYPIVLDASCSHVDPVMTLPLNRPAVLTTTPEPTLYVNADSATADLAKTGSLSDSIYRIGR